MDAAASRIGGRPERETRAEMAGTVRGEREEETGRNAAVRQFREIKKGGSPERRKQMKINNDDRESYVNVERVSRGLAHIAPNEARLTFKDADNGRRLMEALARDFSIYQWTDGVAYDENYELFFWCNDLYNTMGHNHGGRDLRQISLKPNSKKSISDQAEIYDRLRAFLAAWEDGGDGSVYFTWHSVDDAATIKSMAERILASIKQGCFVLWHGMKGRIKFSHEYGYYFMKAGARRNGYLLDWLKILDVRTLDGEEFAA